MAGLSPVEGRVEIVRKMLADPDWGARVVGLVGLLGLSAEQVRDLAGPLARQDPERLVRRLAGAVVELMTAATTQPEPGRGAGGGGEGVIAPPTLP